MYILSTKLTRHSGDKKFTGQPRRRLTSYENPGAAEGFTPFRVDGILFLLFYFIVFFNRVFVGVELELSEFTLAIV